MQGQSWPQKAQQSQLECQSGISGLQCVHSWRDKDDKRAHVHLGGGGPATACAGLFNNDPSAGSPTETLLRLLLPLNDQV
jgi:hypothetical protein